MEITDGTTITAGSRTYVFRQGKWWLAVHDHMHYNVGPDVEELCTQIALLLRKISDG